jgi:hypothetical protein
VGSDDDADFHGFRPVARLRRMMANDQMSLKRGEYVPVGANTPPWHSDSPMQLAEYEIEDEELLTRTHVVNASSAKFLTKPLGGGQPKIGDSDTKSVIKT